MKCLVIIPAYNEERSITTVIDRITVSTPGADILVINDGSTDSTSEKAAKRGAKVIDLPFNLGIGAAMQTGYIYAMRKGYDIAVQVDADGQHDPAYIKHLVEPVANGLADMAIGSRYLQRTAYKSSVSRRIGMLFFSMLVNLLTGQTLKDTTSGFRAINRKVMEYFAAEYPSDYPEVDVLLKLYKKGFKILEIPVMMHGRNSGKSSITPFRSVYYMVKVSLSLFIDAIRP